jgi:2-keto-4-pentenoate hydratase/2-oxohepta-3-ene-1,7-dioic acid hydratase in catechol pathway
VKFASYVGREGAGWGRIEDDSIVPLDGIAPSLRAALEAGTLPQSGGGARLKLSEVELLPPVPDTPRIFCVGLNYAAHREETGRKPSEYPAIFVRFAQSVAGHDAALAAPPESETYDYEGELAVVIGRPGRRIAEGDALAHVAGYACFMDGTIREYQLHTHQYTPGKNFDRSGGFGPYLVTPDEVGDPNGGLRLVTRLNGNVVQEAETGQMLFPVPVVISYLSRFTELRPGDVIATGTPGGVGFKRTPPLFMRPGDTVEVEIDRVGRLVNRIVHDPDA